MFNSKEFPENIKFWFENTKIKIDLNFLCQNAGGGLLHTQLPDNWSVMQTKVKKSHKINFFGLQKPDGDTNFVFFELLHTQQDSKMKFQSREH